MSVVIVGGNECMERRYIELCREYRCRARVYLKMTRELQSMGNPDLIVLFTNTVSHKMIRSALTNAGSNTAVARCHTSSISALKSILEEHTGGKICQTN